MTEAVLLSHRIVALSARPAQVAADIRLPLPRPCRADQIDTAAFRARVAAGTAALFGAPETGASEPTLRAAD